MSGQEGGPKSGEQAPGVLKLELTQEKPFNEVEELEKRLIFFSNLGQLKEVGMIREDYFEGLLQSGLRRMNPEEIERIEQVMTQIVEIIKASKPKE